MPLPPLCLVRCAHPRPFSAVQQHTQNTSLHVYIDFLWLHDILFYAAGRALVVCASLSWSPRVPLLCSHPLLHRTTSSSAHLCLEQIARGLGTGKEARREKPKRCDLSASGRSIHWTPGPFTRQPHLVPAYGVPSWLRAADCQPVNYGHKVSFYCVHFEVASMHHVSLLTAMRTIHQRSVSVAATH